MNLQPDHPDPERVAGTASAGAGVACRFRRLPAILTVLIVAAAVGWAVVRRSPTPASTTTAAGPVLTQLATNAAAPPAGAAAPDPRLREPDAHVASLSDDELSQGLVGRWRTEHHGVQVIDKRDDGTASLDIEFDWLAALLYGRQMELELTWAVENGELTTVISSGKPKANVDRMIADYGDRCAYRILELGENVLLLQEIRDPDAFHRWTRVEGR